MTNPAPSSAWDNAKPKVTGTPVIHDATTHDDERIIDDASSDGSIEDTTSTISTMDQLSLQLLDKNAAIKALNIALKSHRETIKRLQIKCNNIREKAVKRKRRIECFGSEHEDLRVVIKNLRSNVDSFTLGNNHERIELTKCRKSNSARAGIRETSTKASLERTFKRVEDDLLCAIPKQAMEARLAEKVWAEKVAMLKERESELSYQLAQEDARETLRIKQEEEKALRARVAAENARERENRRRSELITVLSHDEGSDAEEYYDDEGPLAEEQYILAHDDGMDFYTD